MVQTNNNKGFTLIELLVVIAIVGVLAAVVLLAINPVELLKKGRDSTRFQDMTNLRKAIDSTIASGGAVTLGCTSECNSGTGTAAQRAATGTGNWMETDLSAYMASLPVDPKIGVTTGNAAGTSPAAPPTGGWTYRFMSAGDGTYEIATYVESNDNASKLTSDGGDDPAMFEVGTDPGLNLI